MTSVNAKIWEGYLEMRTLDSPRAPWVLLALMKMWSKRKFHHGKQQFAMVKWDIFSYGCEIR
jgi:hypothetical protein